MSKISKVASLTNIEFKKIISESTTIKEVAEKIGYSSGRSARWRISDRILSDNLDVSHFRNWIQYKSIPTENLLVSDSKTNNQTIKKRVIEDGLLKYVCVSCGNTGEHNNKPLVLHMDHIDGNNKNNNLSNLRILCPNCHSQTNTYGGKNIKQKK